MSDSASEVIQQAVAAVEAGRLSKHEAVAAVPAAAVEEVLHASFDGGGAVAATTGIGVSPGAAAGQIYFTADAALDAADRGELVLLVMSETSPADEIGMRVSEGILTAKGGTASHAAVVARGWGIPAVCGCEGLVFEGDHVQVGEHQLAEGDTVSLDGSTGEVYVGDLGVASAGVPDELDVLLGWADEVSRGKVGVRANADSGPDAAQARSFGAEGIGLCRTEHMFLGDRLPAVQRMILAADEVAENEALEELAVLQRKDFVEVLEAMDGLPVTVRLLDPPLHEFLPDRVELARAEGAGTLDAEGQTLQTAVEEWAEQNPMLGTRGVRLAILREGLYRMQVRALAAAIGDRRRAGGKPDVGIMIPLVVTAPELALVRRWVEEELAQADVTSDVLIGTMIETPRAALCAGSIARSADFFSFGTNDLTQLTFGFSRDDVEGRILGPYLEKGLLVANPFEQLDTSGVGALVAMGIAMGRASNTDLEVGVCGEHGGDPTSIAFLVEAGVDYVSCSPYRVPVARLAAAQAVLAQAAHPGRVRD